MLTYAYSIILGVVEGLTEFLPVSSTAHMILAAKVLGLADGDFLKSFEIIIQVGAILAVVILYWRSFLNWEVLKRVIAGFIPTAIIGLIFYKIVKSYLLGSEMVVLWALLLGGAAIIIFEMFYHEKEGELGIQTIPIKDCVKIGVFQSIAIIPGVSRSAATILGGLYLGVDRKTIVQYSFLLAVPTMLAASALDILESFSSFSSDQVGTLVVGFIVAFITAMIAIKYFLKFIRNKKFTSFGVYRILLSLFFLVLGK